MSSIISCRKNVFSCKIKVFKIICIKQVCVFYSKYFIPLFGKNISKDEKAYAYLPESVAAFPEGENFKAILTKVGYKNVASKLVSGGIATIYIGRK